MRFGLVKGLYIVVVSLALHVQGSDSSNVEESLNNNPAGAAQSFLHIATLVLTEHRLHFNTRSEAL